jgi:hypothetical protein
MQDGALNVSRVRLSHVGLIVLVASLAHGLWLINDSITNEDWIFVDWIAHRRFDQLYFNSAYSNSYAGFIPFALLAIIGDPVLPARVGGFLLILISAFTVRDIASQFVSLSNATLIALLATVYPGDMQLFAPSLFSYPFYYCSFLVAAAVTIRSTTGHYALAIMIESITCVIFLLSFVMSSLLVFYGAFVLLHFLASARNHQKFHFSTAVWSYVRRNIHYILLPFVYWILRTAVAAYQPVRPGYNNFNLDLAAIFQNTAVFAIHTFSRMAIFFGLATVAILIASVVKNARLQRHCNVDGELDVSGQTLRLLAFGTLLLVLACAPYILVGKSPGLTVDGDYIDYRHWYTRHLILVHLPAAILIVGMIQLLHGLMRTYHIELNRTLLAASVICLFCIIRIEHCLSYQVEGAQDRAVENALRESEIAQAARFYGIATNVSGYGYAGKPDYVWPYFFRYIYGGKLSRFSFDEPYGLDLDAYRDRVFSAASLINQLSWVQRAECVVMGYEIPSADAVQVTIVISAGLLHDTNEIQNAFRYWWYRFARPAEMPRYLNDLTRVSVIAKK